MNWTGTRNKSSSVQYFPACLLTIKSQGCKRSLSISVLKFSLQGPNLFAWHLFKLLNISWYEALYIPFIPCHSVKKRNHIHTLVSAGRFLKNTVLHFLYRFPWFLIWLLCTVEALLILFLLTDIKSGSWNHGDDEHIIKRINIFFTTNMPIFLDISCTCYLFTFILGC